MGKSRNTNHYIENMKKEKEEGGKCKKWRGRRESLEVYLSSVAPISESEYSFRLLTGKDSEV